MAKKKKVFPAPVAPLKPQSQPVQASPVQGSQQITQENKTPPQASSSAPSPCAPSKV